jgi:hypothetical protein
MPCSGVHLLTAGRALTAASRGGPPLPFPLDDPECRACFLHGALGPDMGFVPGADRFVSEVSHYVRSVDLARTLVHRARSGPEAGFAWGWVTHVLTDLVLHPEVGRACGERLRGDRGVRLNAAENLPAHVGMEVGLDLSILASEPGIPAPPRSDGFDGRSIRYLVESLEEVYEIRWSPVELLATHRRSVVMNVRWPRALKVLEWGRGIAGGGRNRVQGLVGKAATGVGSALARPTGAARGFFHPIRPPDWLLGEVRRLADDFPERLALLTGGGLDTLPNHNLETGAPDEAPVPHPDAERTALRVARLRTAAGVPARRPAEEPG